MHDQIGGWRPVEDDDCGPDCRGELSLALPFLSQSPAYVLGWEAAGVWARMQAGDLAISGFYHSANDEQLLLMASREGYAATVVVWDGGAEWSRMMFVKRPQVGLPHA